MILFTPNGGGVILTDNKATIKAKLAMGFTTEQVVKEVVKEAILDEEQQ